MNERDELRLRHALESSERIASYLTGVGRDAFQANRMLQDAVIRNLEIIGEACVRHAILFAGGRKRSISVTKVCGSIGFST